MACRFSRNVALVVALLLHVPAQSQSLSGSSGHLPTASTPDVGGEAGRSVDRRRVGTDALLPSGLSSLAAATPLVKMQVALSQGNRASRAADFGSGVLVSPCLVLTARHLLGAAVPATGAQAGTSSITLRFVGLDGNFTRQAKMVSAGGQSGRQRNPLLDDWALLFLSEPVERIEATQLLPSDCCVLSRMMAATVGYPADRFDRADPKPWVDPDCLVVARLIIGIVAANCQATSGNSGGPLLVKIGTSWHLAGVITRAPAAAAGGALAGKRSYAIPVEQYLIRQISATTLANPCKANSVKFDKNQK